MITDAELNRLIACCREVTTHADAPIEAKLGALSMMLDPLVIDVRRIANAAEKLAERTSGLVLTGGPDVVGAPYNLNYLQSANGGGSASQPDVNPGFRPNPFFVPGDF